MDDQELNDGAPSAASDAVRQLLGLPSRGAGDVHGTSRRDPQVPHRLDTGAALHAGDTGDPTGPQLRGSRDPGLTQRDEAP
jgi:hypothetical protein